MTHRKNNGSNFNIKMTGNNYTTIPVCETAENVNGPSQQFVDERAWLSARCINPKARKIPVREAHEQTLVLREDEQRVDEQQWRMQI